jgi:hypothetical protein
MPTILTEQIDLSEAQIDHEQRVLRNVKLISAGTSLNKRHYSEAVLTAAVSLFEGTKAYDGHMRGERRVGEITGAYSNVRLENGALRADRYFTRTQAGNDVFAIAEDIVSGKAPRSLAGLSINAVGNAKPGKIDGSDVVMVESITAVHSVDDVSVPAAGGGYTEAASGDAMTKSLLDAMTIEEYTEARPDFIQRLQKEWKTMRDGKVVEAAKADADQATEALNEAQATIARLTEERDAAVTEAETARRALSVEQVLNDPRTKLPAIWKTELRSKLSESDPKTWGALMGLYQKLAESAGHSNRVPVSGADQQISIAEPLARRVDPLAAARKALAEASSPEELLRIQESLKG